MHPDFLDILRHQDLPITNEQLIAYLSGNLSEAENHEVERRLSSAGIGQDAWDGLQTIKNKQDLPAIQKLLHQQLEAQLAAKPTRRNRQISFNWTLLVAVTSLIIILCVAIWFLIHYLSKQ